MNVKKILFPTDFSPASEAAFGYATSLARATDATLLILHVEEPVVPYGAGEVLMTDAPTEGARQKLETVVPNDRSVKVEHRLVLGSPADQIVRIAEDDNVKLIVMGTHGRSGLSRLIMGSVAEEVVRRAVCPVLTLKQPHETPIHA